MTGNPYEKFRGKLILRDYLAADRTLLAGERTFLSYLRTGLGIMGLGVAFIKFFEDASVLLPILGWICLPLGAAISVFGATRYVRVRRSIICVLEEAPEPGPDADDPDMSRTAESGDPPE